MSELRGSDERVESYALSAETLACKASELRVGDTFLSFAGPRLITAIERPEPGRLKLVWRGGGADLDDGAKVYALWGTRR